MNLVDIKKALYKQKPIAELKYIRMGTAYYTANIIGMIVNFEIPVSDMGTVGAFTFNLRVTHTTYLIIS